MLALAGCGGDGGDAPPSAAGPTIERAVAENLAAASDDLAERLETGDACGATRAAARLRSGVTEAINAGQVPQAYLEDLSGLVNELEAQVPACSVPAPAPPPEEAGEDGDDGNGKGRRKHKGKDEDKRKGKKKDEGDDE